ncbi:histidine kinase [Sediminibacterium sp.]|uniref:sensor histidine kinase n=1 Tax=Sediminibacterium sp. TaxID=1917865 RepID=UPI0025E11310|nr:histidine kinase [Sediminibacterium sp.]MBW0176754.1 histidine kinase [Sediminibacterium sp.]
MLLSEIAFIGCTYFTIWLYKLFFSSRKYLTYFLIGICSWVFYLVGKTAFQFYYLQEEPSFQNNRFLDVILNNIAFLVAYFLFLTFCKYFKDGYIRQHFEAEKKQQQLTAEVNNLKSQIAPHFLFNTLNNLYGLSVEKSDKLPDLMLRLSDLLRHSLYETQKPLVPVNDEIDILKSYIKLESIRLEDDLKLDFNSTIPEKSEYLIAPLILIVFIENAFKHARFVDSGPVIIWISTTLDDNLFTLMIENNYNTQRKDSANGIGLINVMRRLEVLYPNQQHLLTISRGEVFYTVILQLQLSKY